MRHIATKGKVREAIRAAYLDLLSRIPQTKGSEKISLQKQALKIESAMKSWKGAANG